MLLIELFCQRIGFCHSDKLEETSAEGIGFDTTLVDKLPESVHDASADDWAIVAEEAITVVMLRSEFPGAEAAETRNPYWWMRLLDRARPDVDHWQLIILTIPGKNIGGGPGFQEQVMRFVI